MTKYRHYRGKSRAKRKKAQMSVKKTGSKESLFGPNYKLSHLQGKENGSMRSELTSQQVKHVEMVMVGTLAAVRNKSSTKN